MGSENGAAQLLDLGKAGAVARERINVYDKGSMQYL